MGVGVAKMVKEAVRDALKTADEVATKWAGSARTGATLPCVCASTSSPLGWCTNSWPN